MAHRLAITAVFASLAAALALVSCSDAGPASVAEVKAQYAKRLARGAMVGMTYIEADRVDPATSDLINVRIEAKNAVYAADRGEIVVDPIEQTVRLRLMGVVGAGEEGVVLELGEITTPPARLKQKVSDALPPPVVDR